LDKAEYLKVFRNEVDAFLAAAERGLDIPVAACSPWTVGELAVHLGGVYIHIRAICRGGLNKPPPFNEQLLVAGEAERELARSPRVIDWFRSEAESMETTLRGLDPDHPVWTFGPPHRRDSFWHRRMAQETIIHRWDAESAHSLPRPIETGRAVDGLEEIADTWIARSRRRSKLAGTGESYLFRPTDIDRAWLVRFDADQFEVVPSSGPADVTVAAPASDLLLFLWRRVPRDRLSIEGDSAILDRYFELAPPN
jgi:uncharacterized protein (TIGR03083 family)